MKKSLLLGAALCCLICGCNGQDECSRQEMDHCNDDGSAILVCQGGSWIENYCEQGFACGYLDGAVQCLQSAGLRKCQAGVVVCENDVLRTCDAAGIWHYTACGTGKTCGNNECVDKSVTPPPPVDTVSGIIKRTCSADKLSIESTDDKGTVKSEKCRDLVGFDSVCESYGAGHVGCALPEECSDIFSVEGTCIGDRRLWCDEDYLSSKPAVVDCSVVDKTCVVKSGVADCYQLCDSPDPSALACVNSDNAEYVTRCISAGDVNVVEASNSICIDDSTSASCSSGAVVETKCAEGEKCMEPMGACVITCSEEKLGDVMCSSSGELLLCSKIADGFAYVSMGKRHCANEHLLQCVLNSETSAYEIKDANCAEYKNTDGSIIHAKCVMDYQYYPDMDLCVASEGGEPCGELTEAGICDGSMLKYCDSVMNEAVNSNCANNEYGYTNCSVYSNYADCRKSCKKSGSASCIYNTNSESYILTLCAPDDRTKNLVEIEGTAICLGNTLYECDEQGKSIMTDCAANGGRCDTNECVYPACGIDKLPVCMADDAMVSCEISADGRMKGSALQTMTCSPDGICMTCHEGRLVTE